MFVVMFFRYCVHASLTGFVFCLCISKRVFVCVSQKPSNLLLNGNCDLKVSTRTHTHVYTHTYICTHTYTVHYSAIAHTHVSHTTLYEQRSAFNLIVTLQICMGVCVCVCVCVCTDMWLRVSTRCQGWRRLWLNWICGHSMVSRPWGDVQLSRIRSQKYVCVCVHIHEFICAVIGLFCC